MKPRDIMSETPKADAFVQQQEAAEISIWAALTNIQEFSRQLERELTQAQARCAELEKDAARYRWLRERGHDGAVFVTLSGPGRPILILAQSQQLDECIDAALKEPR